MLDTPVRWWRLPDQVPRLFMAGLIGSLAGCVMGAAAGLGIAIRFGDHLGVLLGIIVGVAAGLLAGVASIQRQDFPRTIDLHFRWDYWRFTGCLTVGVVVGLASGYADARHGGLIAGLVIVVAAGPACAMSTVRAFGWAAGVNGGIATALGLGLPIGLSAGNGQPVLSGLLAGLVFTISGVIIVTLFQPARDSYAVTPRSLLSRDRVGSLTVAGSGGIEYGVLYGIALGPLFGMIALVTVSVVALSGNWIPFGVSRVWLALTGMTPMAHSSDHYRPGGRVLELYPLDRIVVPVPRDRVHQRAALPRPVPLKHQDRLIHQPATVRSDTYSSSGNPST